MANGNQPGQFLQFLQSTEFVRYVPFPTFVYMRFFRRVSPLTYEEARAFCNVDFEKTLPSSRSSVPARTRRLLAQAPIS